MFKLVCQCLFVFIIILIYSHPQNSTKIFAIYGFVTLPSRQARSSDRSIVLHWGLFSAIQNNKRHRMTTSFFPQNSNQFDNKLFWRSRFKTQLEHKNMYRTSKNSRSIIKQDQQKIKTWNYHKKSKKKHQKTMTKSFLNKENLRIFCLVISEPLEPQKRQRSLGFAGLRGLAHGRPQGARWRGPRSPGREEIKTEDVWNIWNMLFLFISIMFIHFIHVFCSWLLICYLFMAVTLVPFLLFVQLVGP